MPADKEVRAIQEKYQRLFTEEMGRYYKIPECCIQQFCKELEYGIAPALYREKVWNVEISSELGYIPCNSCITSRELKKYIKKL